jgi:hypothetical protein
MMGRIARARQLTDHSQGRRHAVTIAYSPFTRTAERPTRPGDHWTEVVVGGPERPQDALVARPILARIPDVERTARPAPRVESPPQRASGIRIDPPTARGPAGRHVMERAVTQATHRRRRTESAHDLGRRQAPATSKILPAGNPFDGPSERLQDSMAPIVRFLLLFALFTAAGTFILTIGESSRTVEAERTAPMAAIDPAIAVPTALEPPISTQRTVEVLTPDTTAGPAIAGPEKGAAAPRPTTRTASHVTSPEHGNVDEHASLPAPSAETEPQDYPTTSFPPVTIPSRRDVPLPRVRTTDRTPAVARTPARNQQNPTR